MPPDFLLACTACGAETVWDTEVLPPVGEPEVGHPVLWFCVACQIETRHQVQGEVVLPDKLHHDICVATELDRETVDRVMGEMRAHHPTLAVGAAETLLRTPEAVDAIAAAARVAEATVRDVIQAEAAWSRRRGYVRRP
jgi:hypothetical protein